MKNKFLYQKTKQFGKNNPNYKHGKTYNNRCADCEKIISFISKRCIKHYKEFIKQNSQNANNYIDGKSLKKYYCIDCEIELNNRAYCLGTKRCKSCESKRRFKNPKNHPMYIDGLSKYPYSIKFNNKLKEFIRERDNYACQLCNRMGNHVHHINYNKENCKENNLITLCNQCNLKVNVNRDYWFAYFTYIIN